MASWQTPRLAVGVWQTVSSRRCLAAAIWQMLSARRPSARQMAVWQTVYCLVPRLYLHITQTSPFAHFGLNTSKNMKPGIEARKEVHVRPEVVSFPGFTVVLRPIQMASGRLRLLSLASFPGFTLVLRLITTKNETASGRSRNPTADPVWQTLSARQPLADAVSARWRLPDAVCQMAVWQTVSSRRPSARRLSGRRCMQTVCQTRRLPGGRLGDTVCQTPSARCGVCQTGIYQTPSARCTSSRRRPPDGHLADGVC